MRAPASRSRSRAQAGYTLVELIIAVAIGGLVLTAATSVVLTTWRASDTATSRVEASSQIRSFESFAYDDFALSNSSSLSGCTASSPCSTPITLTGTQASNAVNPTLNPGYTVTYSWNQAGEFLDRQVGANPSIHASTGVTAFSWYVDSNSTVVVSLTVTVSAYSESQTLRFYPRVNP